MKLYDKWWATKIKKPELFMPPQTEEYKRGYKHGYKNGYSDGCDDGNSNLSDFILFGE